MTDPGLRPLLQLAARQPLLDANQELDLIAAAQAGNQPAIEKLVLSHLKLAIALARPFARTSAGVQLSDLIQEASIGLAVAIQKFDASRGCRFSTGCRPWVRAQLTTYVRKQRSVVKVGETAAVRRTFWNLARVRAQIGALDAVMTDQQCEAIARRLRVASADIRAVEALNADVSINAHVSVGETDGTLELVDLIPADDPTPEEMILAADTQQWQRRILEQGLARLDARTASMLRERFLSEDGATFDQLATAHGVTRARAHQLVADGLRRLKARLSKRGVDHMDSSLRSVL